MPVRTTNGANFFNTELSLPVNTSDLTFYVKSTEGAPELPFYLVFEGGNEVSEEVIYIDGEVTGNSFVTTSIANRGLAGSAGGGPNEHGTGSPVFTAFVSQHLEDLQDLIASKVGSGGVVEAADGDVTEPAYSFATDLNMGLFRKSADVLGVTANSTEVLSIGTAAISTTTATIETVGGSAAAPGFAFAVDTNTGLYREAENVLAIATGGARRAKVDLTDWTFDVAVKLPNGTAASPALGFAADPDTGLFRLNNALVTTVNGAAQVEVFDDGSTKNVRPAVDNVHDLGQSARKWRDIWFSGNIKNNGRNLAKWELVADVTTTSTANISISGIGAQYHQLHIELINMQSSYTYQYDYYGQAFYCRVNGHGAGHRYNYIQSQGGTNHAAAWQIGNLSSMYDGSDSYQQRTNGTMDIITNNGNDALSPQFHSQLTTQGYGPNYFFSSYQWQGYMQAGYRQNVSSLLFYAANGTPRPGCRIVITGLTS